MRLTMYMALDALAAFMPEPTIVNGDVRLVGPLLGEGEGRLWLSEDGDGVHIRGGADSILVRSASLAAVHDVLTGALAEWDAWERRLMDAAAEAGLQDIVNGAYALFDEPILLTDARDQIVAITAHPRGSVNDEWDYTLEHGNMPTRRLIDIYRDPQFTRIGDDGAPFIFNPPGMMHRGINMRFMDEVSKEWIGVGVIIEHKAALTIGKLHLAESFYEAVKRYLRLHPAAETQKTENLLLAELFELPAGSERSVWMRARLFPDARRFYIAVLRAAAQRPIQHAVPALVSSFPGLRALQREKELIALFPWCAEAKEKLSAVCMQTDSRAGLCRSFADWRQLTEYLAQARTALENGSEWVNELDGRSVNALCDKTLNEQLGGLALGHPALDILAAYDARHAAALSKTLYTYLVNERNLIKTAEALFIHRNSLVYRIRRITELCGIRFEDAEERQYLLHSFALMEGGAYAP